MDGTGWHVFLSNLDQYGVNQTATIINKSGVQYVVGFAGHCSRPNILPPPGGLQAANAQNTAMNYDSYMLTPTTCNEHSVYQYVIDPNGNKMSFLPPLVSGNPPLDTMGRPTWPLQGGAFTTDSTNCGISNLPFNQALLMTYQGANGSSNRLKVCYGTLTPQTTFNVPNVTEYQNSPFFISTP